MDDNGRSVSQETWRIARALSGSMFSAGENGVWSPACLAEALAVAREGASGATRRELDALLGNVDYLGIRDPFGIAIKNTWGYSGYDANSVAAVWISKTTSASAEFLRKCEEGGVHVSIDDLADERVSREISSWVSERTRGLLFPAIEVDSDALACLVSALYLKDAWAEPFEGRLTEVGQFHAEQGDVRAAFMRDERECAVLDEKGWVAFGLRLSSSAAVLFALPIDAAAPAEEAIGLFERLACGGGAWESVDLRIPRFECESTLLDVTSILKEAGVSTAHAMDLVSMVGKASVPTQLAHGARLVVDEHGLEAGAYTMMVACAGLPPENPPQPRRIVLDHPFYVAVASQTGAPLFVGRVAVPSGDVSVWRDVEYDDDSDIWRDEELEGLCRVTAEMDCERDLYELTCGIYGIMVHTVFAGSYFEAEEKFDALKCDLEGYVRHCEEDGFDDNAWIEAFIDRW